MDETTKTARSVRAEQLLGDPLLIEAMRELETRAVQALAQADVSDHAALLRATADLQAARRFTGWLHALVEGRKITNRTRPVAA